MQGNQLVEKLSVLWEIHISRNSRPGSWETSAQSVLRQFLHCARHCLGQHHQYPLLLFLGQRFWLCLFTATLGDPHQSRSAMLHDVHCTQEYSNFYTGRAVVILQGRVTGARESPNSRCHSNSFVSTVSHLQTPFFCPLCMLVLIGYYKPP